jgi:excisionase family DNA binding protein
MEMSAIQGLLTLQEVADLYGVSHSQVARYVREGRLSAVQIGQQKLVPEAAAKSFQRRKAGRPVEKIEQLA